MISHRHITKIVSGLMAALLCLCLAAMVFSEVLVEAIGGVGITMEYERALFDTASPMEVNIIMDDSQWEEMLANAMSEQYYQCDVEINGQTFYRVGIRPKGNTSLSSIASDPNTNRFSLKLEFDQYVDGQTCYGLDKLILNNNYADATNMKEALVYDMYQYLGADASLYNYAKISVNGAYWGVYLALEAVEDSLLLRSYGVKSGELYKPDSMEFGGGGGGNFGPGNMDPAALTPPQAEGGEAQRPSGQALPGGGMGGRSSSGRGGADLNYTDDELDSYSTIWDGEVTNSGTADHKRVVTALKNISEGTDLERYMDIDNLLKYMAVHVFSVNQDSLSGSMAHNYYLYEYEGRLNLLPWDYNLAFGGMGGNDASGMVNDAIDTPWGGTNFFDTLMADETYLERYHAYLRQLVEAYVNGGGFSAFYERTRGQIDTLVETDPNAFYTFEAYTEAVEALRTAVELRGRSVSGQLDGTIPATDSGQRADASALIDASSLDLSVMGSMNAGGGGGRGGFAFGGRGGISGESGEGEARTAPEDTASGGAGRAAWGLSTTRGGKTGQGQPGEPPAGFDPSQFGGQAPEDFDPSQFGGQAPEDFDPSQFGGGPQGSVDPAAGDGENQAGGGSAPTDSPEASPSAPENSQGNTQRNPFENGNLPTSFTRGQSSTAASNLITYAICFAVLIAALIFAARYRRRAKRR